MARETSKSLAPSARSSSRADLPIPAGPSNSTAFPWPARASRSRSARRRRSGPRPTSSLCAAIACVLLQAWSQLPPTSFSRPRESKRIKGNQRDSKVILPGKASKSQTPKRASCGTTVPNNMLAQANYRSSPPLPGSLSEEAAVTRAALPLGLLGRSQERHRLTDLLQSAQAGSGIALVIQGEAGIGKSALLDDLAANAGDVLVCRVAGVESEMELPFAALEHLCGPLLGHVVDLPVLHRGTLGKAFGLTTGPRPDLFMVGMAVLDLIAAVTRSQTMLWIVDDAQWLDQASRQTVGFVCRRLRGERLAAVVAVRDTKGARDLTGLPQLRLQGLSRQEAGRFLDSVVTGPSDALVRDRVIAETRGNPLALLELPRSWTTAELVEGFSESERVPGDLQLERAFAKRLGDLPVETRRLLTLAAAEPRGDPALLWSAAKEMGLDWRAAGAAEAQGLAEFSQHVHFRHPLVRAAAY